VVLRLIVGREREQFLFLKPGEQAGRVIEILERATPPSPAPCSGAAPISLSPPTIRACRTTSSSAIPGGEMRPVPRRRHGCRQAPGLARSQPQSHRHVIEKLGRAFEPRAAELAAIYHKYDLTPVFRLRGE